MPFLDARYAESVRVMCEDETLIGQYLLTDVVPGAPVLPDMVKAAPTRERGPNALAVVVNVPAAKATYLGLLVNMPVTLIRPGRQRIEYGEVIAKECDARTCSLTISLPKLPGQIIDPVAFAAVDVEPAVVASGL
jgi:hypothetical protein